MTRRVWRVRFSGEAERDFRLILTYSANHFGRVQAEAYRDLLMRALASLEEGPNVLGSIPREEILPGLRSLHISRTGHRGRHFILFRAENPETILILRILHDAMDFKRNLPG